jgi:hypothetical protein
MRESARKSCFGNLEVNFLPLEAVLLLKAVTGCEGDLSDMEAIIRSKIDWRLFERIYWEEIESVGGGSSASPFSRLWRSSRSEPKRASPPSGASSGTAWRRGSGSPSKWGRGACPSSSGTWISPR